MQFVDVLLIVYSVLEKFMTEITKKKCISIGPFGSNQDEISFRHDLEILLKEALTPKYEYRSFSEVPNTDMTSDLFKAIVDADLVIADLRGLNPNVMYELGIRHAFNKPTIHLRDNFTKLPWDIDKNFTLTYPLPIQLSHKEKLVVEIRERVERVLALDPNSNPSYSTLNIVIKVNAQIDKLPQVNSDLKDVLNLISKQVRDLNSKVDDMKPMRVKSGSEALSNNFDFLTPTWAKHNILPDYIEALRSNPSLHIQNSLTNFDGSDGNKL